MQVPFIVENNNNYSCEQTLNYKTRNHREGRGVQETPWYNAITPPPLPVPSFRRLAGVLEMGKGRELRGANSRGPGSF